MITTAHNDTNSDGNIAESSESEASAQDEETYGPASGDEADDEDDNDTGAEAIAEPVAVN